MGRIIFNRNHIPLVFIHIPLQLPAISRRAIEQQENITGISSFNRKSAIPIAGHSFICKSKLNSLILIP